MKTVQEILQEIVWKDDQQSGSSLGVLNEVFPTAEILVVKNSRNNARRATVMLKDNGKVTHLICSEKVTDLLRADKLQKEHLAGFPIIWNETQSQMYLGLPSQGWIEVKTIKVAQWVPEAISPEDLVN